MGVTQDSTGGTVVTQMSRGMQWGSLSGPPWRSSSVEAVTSVRVLRSTGDLWFDDRLDEE